LVLLETKSVLGKSSRTQERPVEEREKFWDLQENWRIRKMNSSSVNRGVYKEGNIFSIS
jgi:hypothetical protein